MVLEDAMQQQAVQELRRKSNRVYKCGETIDVENDKVELVENQWRHSISVSLPGVDIWRSNHKRCGMGCVYRQVRAEETVETLLGMEFPFKTMGNV